MYNDYFGLREAPFSIAPNPQYLFMSPRHREALAHLLYGIQSDGGFILLTGEVGTGKTTVCRCLLEQIPEDVDTAYILNPKQTAQEILATACDELHIDYPMDASIKVLVDRINKFLLTSHQNGRRTVLIIDEAQNLSVDVLEQLRLLTNLETNQRKLLQIILLGQPELLTLLAKQELRQLSQRVTARFHLDALSRDEVAEYIQHRLDTAGAKGSLFPPATVKRVYAISKGIPRLVNLVCDRALLGTYVQNRLQVDVSTVNHAAKEILGEQSKTTLWPFAAAAAVLFIAILSYFLLPSPADPVVVTAESISSIGATAQAGVNTEPSNQQTKQPIAQLTEQPRNDLAVMMPSDPNTQTTPVPTTSINDLIGYSEQKDAFAVLLQIWGAVVVLADNTDPCRVAEVSGLRCLSKLGSLRDVAHLNRPIVLGLETRNSSSWFVLTVLDQNVVTLTANGESYPVSSSDLLTAWSGFFTLLWRAPPAYQQPVKLGDRGAAVDWLMTQLAIVEGVKPPSITESRMFDQDLEARVKRFQISVGLVPDGIVGDQTWIHLNSSDFSDIPSIRRSNEAAG